MVNNPIAHGNSNPQNELVSCGNGLLTGENDLASHGNDFLSPATSQS